MTCVGCAAQIADGSRFCPACGAEQRLSGQQPVSAADPQIGRIIEDKYRIDAVIGEGGMATVYRATRLLIGDTVAVKILHGEQLRDPQAPERFRREAQAAARLKHPNAVTIYDFGVSAEGTIYLVMELVEGQSLRKLIKDNGPLLPSAASQIISQACSALDEAHRQQIIHRDIKPDNILVAMTTVGPRVKVLDFGIARLRDLSTVGNLTQTGSVMGTPQYMSPEQCLGEELDGRSDIYSLGIVLYEMLVGVVPFNSPTSMAVVVQHVNATPAPLRVLNVSIPPAVEIVVLHALEKRRESRPQTAGALADELAGALTGPGNPVYTPALRPASGPVAMSATVQMPTPWQMRATSPTGPAGEGGSSNAGRRAGNVLTTRTVVLVASVGAASLAGIGTWFWSRTSRPAQSDTKPAAAELPVAALTAPAAAAPPVQSPAAPPPSLAAPAPVATPDPSTVRASKAAVTPQPPSPRLTPGAVTLQSTANSAVFLDGTQIGTTGADGSLRLSVQPGQHQIGVRKDRYRNEERSFLAASGRSDVIEMALTPLPGSLAVLIDVTGATMRVDGRSVEQSAQIELSPGSHKVVVTKAGFTPSSVDVEIHPGEVSRVPIKLAPLSADELIGEANKYLQAGDYDRAISSAKMVLSTTPDQPQATRVIGYANYRARRFSEAATYLSKAIDLGALIELPVKHHHAGFPGDGLCDGVLMLSKTSFGFHSSTEVAHSFSVSPDKILELRNEPQKASRVHTKVVIKNGSKEEKKDYNFQNNGARLVNRSTSNVAIYSVNCSGCDDSMNVVYALIEKIMNPR